MEIPKISIVTPSFNQVKYLPETIESILGQNYPNLEYIIIDGGSIDGSVDIIKKYERRLAYWISEKDNGQSDAIMKGFNIASGEIFAWVNSDDILLEGCLSEISKCYLKSSRPDIITSNVIYINADGTIRKYVRIPKQNRFFFFKGVWYAQAPVIFFKTDSFQRAGGPNPKYNLCMDLDIWMKMMKNRMVVMHIKHYFGAFRFHEESKTTNYVKHNVTKFSSPLSPEKFKILKENLPGFSVKKTYLWRVIYKLYQLINFNYLQAYLKKIANRNRK